MATSPFDSALYAELFGDAELAALFTDDAALAAMIAVEAALARAQAAAGLVPAEAAEAVAAGLAAFRPDPVALAAATGANGVPVPGLLAAARAALPAGAAEWLHRGATSQDIVDTGLVLRLRRALEMLEARRRALLGRLADLAEAHADLPMAARTYGQAAVPTSFGAVVAGWGWPLVRLGDRLAEMRPRLLAVSLGGAAGTLAAMEGRGAAVRAALASALGLSDPGASWHSARDRIAELSAWAAGVATALGKMGEDLTALAQSEVAEVRLPGGGSSAMPQKVNPIGPAVLVALARAAVACDAGLQGAALHRQQRDGAAWFTEWLLLPPLLMACGRGLLTAQALAGAVAPDPARMAANLGTDLGLIHAEALARALSRNRPRTEAAAELAALCDEARATGTPLPVLAAARFPDTPLPAPDTGEAPAEARRFAVAARG